MVACDIVCVYLEAYVSPQHMYKHVAVWCWYSLASSRASQVAEEGYRTSRVCRVVLCVHFNSHVFSVHCFFLTWLHAPGRLLEMFVSNRHVHGVVIHKLPS